MSISRMRKSLQKRLKLFAWIFAGLFFLSIFTFWGMGGSAPGDKGVPPGYVAKINGVRVSTEDFRRLLEAQEEGYFLGSGPEGRISAQLSLLNKLISDITLSQAIKKEKIRVSDKEVTQKIEEIINQQIEERKKERKGNLPNEKELRDSLRKELEAERGAIKQRLLIEKLQKKIESEVRVTEEDLRNSYTRVHLRGIPAKREEEAKRILQEAERENFVALAKRYARDEREKKQGGDLGWISLEVLPPSAKRVIGEMKKGDIRIVKLGTRFMVVKLEDKKIDLPPDFDKKKEELLKQYTEFKKKTAFNDYLQELEANASVIIYDPLLKSAHAYEMGDLKTARKYIDEALSTSPDDPYLLYFLAKIEEESGNKEEALKLYQRVANEAYFGQAFFKWANLLEKMGKKKEAIEVYKKASEHAGNDIFLHQALKQKFEELKMGEESKKEAEVLKRLTPVSNSLPVGGTNAP